MAQLDPYVDRLLPLVQMDQASQRSMETFHLLCDKQIASMAAYKALGLDPRDAPQFGWMMQQKPSVAITNTTTIPESRSNWKQFAGIAISCVLGSGITGAGIAAYQWWNQSVKPPIDPVELEVRWKLGEGGKWQTEINRVPK